MRRLACLFSGAAVFTLLFICSYYVSFSPSEPVLYNSEDLNHLSRILLTEKDETEKTGVVQPALEMELARRQATQVSRDMLLFLRYHISNLKEIRNKNSSTEQSWESQEKLLKYILDNMVEYQSAINDQIGHMADTDGWNTWRKQELKALKNIVQKRLYRLQNPKDCETAPVLHCNLTSPYGFASAVHDVLWCFIKAYYSRQRLVLSTSSWHYIPYGWETVFRPLTDTCGEEMPTPASSGPGLNNDESRRLMSYLPEDLGPRILRIHGNPLAWWYGQFLYYLMRPNAHLEEVLDNLKQKINFNDTIVGVHVRRTDKTSEAKIHQLEDYMEYVDEYFIGQEMIRPEVTKRRIYLATDDPQVITACKNRFKKYISFYNSGGSTLASDLKTRYSNASTWDLLEDIFLLANTNFLVCTFSSGICRLAYELMQALNTEDASQRFVSLDVPYHYAWLTTPPRKSIYHHKAKSENEMDFKKGEMFKKESMYAYMSDALKGKTSNGFENLMKINKPREKLLIPKFKTTEIYNFTKTPCFSDYDQ